jgi:HlyD family secretion protein
MKKFVTFIVVVSVIGLFIWTLVYLFRKSEEKPVLYEYEKPFITDIVKKTVATGSVVPKKEVAVKPRISGIIEKLYIQPGDYVKKGQLLAKITIIPDMAQLNSAESRLEQAKISLQRAELDYNRYKKLYEEQVVSEAEFLPFEEAYKKALSELEAAQANLEIVKEGAARKKGEVSNTLIRSTVEGMVLEVPVKEGNSVIEANNFNEGTTIASIADMNNMIFEGKVDESEVGKIKEGMDLVLTIGALPNQTFAAKLFYIAPKGKDVNGAVQFDIKANVLVPDSVFIRAGYSANADIVLDKKEQVLAIKESLIITENDSVFVEKAVGEQKFVKTPVITGISDGINIEIIKGITLKDSLKGREISVEEQNSQSHSRRRKK